MSSNRRFLWLIADSPVRFDEDDALRLSFDDPQDEVGEKTFGFVKTSVVATTKIAQQIELSAFSI
jgi:hypothetical protein